MIDSPNLKLRGLWLAVAWLLVLVIIYLSLTTDPVIIEVPFEYQDKFFHALAYFVLMFWFAQIYHTSKTRMSLAVALIFMGIFLEFIQSLNPVRFYEVADMVANTVGVVTGYLLTLTSAKNILLKIENVVIK